jgi:uncharacterized membrane protein
LFGRISVLVLSIEWIVFGSMHFSLPGETVRQMPAVLPQKELLATISGMIEVAIGVFILVPRVRRWAAACSFVLLIIYIWPVFVILSDHSSEPLRIAFRLGLIPNNVFLLICSYYLWENAAPTQSVQQAAPVSKSFQADFPLLIVAFLLLMSNCAGFLAIMMGMKGHVAQASMWAMMCIATGALLGFLFGVPRVNPNVKAEVYLLPNTNVETVSDWLTKIIVGIGLVNFKSIGEFIDRLAEDLSKSLQADKTFALALILYFFIVGVIQGYILTRMFLTGQFLQDVQGRLIAAKTGTATPESS